MEGVSALLLPTLSSSSQAAFWKTWHAGISSCILIWLTQDGNHAGERVTIARSIDTQEKDNFISFGLLSRDQSDPPCRCTIETCSRLSHYDQALLSEHMQFVINLSCLLSYQVQPPLSPLSPSRAVHRAVGPHLRRFNPDPFASCITTLRLPILPLRVCCLQNSLAAGPPCHDVKTVQCCSDH